MADEFKRLRLITTMKPAQGGWHFPQPFESGPITIAAGSAVELLQKVTTFRIENALPMGDPAADIAAYIKARSPLNDGGRRLSPLSHVGTEVKAMPRVPLIEFMKAWLVGMAKRDVSLVREDEAENRALICAQCPHNVQWQVSCTPCNDDIEFRSSNLRQRPRWQLDKRLRGCRLHRMHLKSGVFIDRSHLPPRHEKAPEPCWVGKNQ